MRNRTAIRLLIALAVIAAIVPPLVMIGYAHRLSVTQVSRELEALSADVVQQTESIIDSTLHSLKKLANEIREPSDHELRAHVRDNPFLQAITIRSGTDPIAESDPAFRAAASEAALRRTNASAIGEFRIHGPVTEGLSSPTIVVSYRAGPDLFVDGFISAKLVEEFSGQNPRKPGTRVFILYNDDVPLAEIEDRTADLREGEIIADAGVQRLDAALAAVAASDTHPIRVAALADFSAVSAYWAHSGPRLALAGVLISGVLCYLVIRAARRLNTLEAELREAIKFDEIVVFYQPVIDIETNRCIGAEALMRWKHPQRGMTRAGDFIDVAERTRLILPMTDKVIEIVAKDFGALQKESPGLHVAINLAPQHFTNANILETVRETLTGSGVPIENVIFEITERSLVAGSDSIARTVMNGLLEFGAKLAVDDFGTGYSNLSYLQRFPVDFLKIDKIFVDNIHSEDSSTGLVDQIIRIGKMLNMEIIAEGIEHARQVAYLRKEGVRLAQGWFFGEPMPIGEFRDFVMMHNADAAEAET